MSTLVIEPVAGPLRGSVPVPSDKSISHRALIFAALGGGRSVLRHFSYGEDNMATLQAFAKLGVSHRDDGQGSVVVDGVGLAGLTAPDGPIDCGNSGTTMRLLCGVLAAQAFQTRLVGDASLSRRPMGRVVFPLRQRGAVIDGAPHPRKPGDLTAPLVVGPLPEGQRLSAIEYEMPISSAQVKSAILLSGLFAAGPTLVKEPVVSRDHTERMLDALGIPLDTMGTLLKLHPPAKPDAIRPFDIELPGDLSAAAFLLVAAQLVGGSQITVRGTGLNPTRAGIIDIIRRMGGNVGLTPQGEVLGEPVGELTGHSARLVAARIGGELAVRAIDEIPIACALAARAAGRTEIADVAELRVKESDRIAAIVELLGAFGVESEEHETGLVVVGRPEGPLRAARVSSRGDHRVAMTAAVLGLLADGPTVIEDVDCIATSFPRFAGTLRALGANAKVSS